jgi:4-hydroxybenzoate polyprenyltransferase
VIDDPELRRLIDFSQPAALLVTAWPAATAHGGGSAPWPGARNRRAAILIAVGVGPDP